MGMQARWRSLLIGLIGILTLLSLAPVAASSANISHAYHSNQQIRKGSLVSLVSGQSDRIEPANVTNGDRLVGVTVPSQDSLLAVDPSSDTTQVATDGTVNALVSDVNGDIKSGDQVAVSPFNGVGMKADPGSRIIGLAQTSFSGQTGSTSQQVTDRSGKSHTIKVGYVRLGLAIGTASADSSLNGLEKLAVQLTGHKVSIIRLVLSLIIGIVALVLLVSLTYGAIYGSIISIGRNPLAKFAVFRTLRSVIAMVVFTGVLAGLLIFLLLR
jgi:hypothetical protein